jgi:hypothetical protein
VRYIEIVAVESGQTDEPFSVRHFDGASLFRQDIQLAKLLECAIDVDDRKPRRICQVHLGKRNGCAVDADRFPPNQLLAQEMGDALKRWLSANVEQPFAEYARLKHTGAPQGQA